MKINLRIPRNLYNQALSDIARPHSFAAERIGFFYGRIGTISDNEFLVLISSYGAVPDECYIEDAYCGARINSTAIRNAMQKALSQKCGVFHVHLHAWNGRASFSTTDRKDQGKLIQSFKNAMPQQAHGQIVFTYNNYAGLVLLPDIERTAPITGLSIVGTPLGYSKGRWYA
jgi:hypothetical protein